MKYRKKGVYNIFKLLNILHKENMEKINIGNLEGGKVEDIFREMAFHFSPKGKESSISKDGLLSQIGTNSSGTLGKEATPRISFSCGINGMMQMFNHTLGLFGQMEVSKLKTYKECIPNFATIINDEDRKGKTLSVLEAFEATRKYMDDNIYYVFGLNPVEYANGDAITSEFLEGINGNIDNLDITVDVKKFTSTSTETEIEEFIEEVFPSNEPEREDEKKEEVSSKDTKSEEDTKEAEKKERKEKAIEQIKSILKGEGGEDGQFQVKFPKTTVKILDELIMKSISDKKENEELRSVIDSLRKELRVKIREVSEGEINSIRGKAIDTQGKNYEIIDFNEEQMRWYDARELPHNCKIRSQKTEQKQNTGEKTEQDQEQEQEQEQNAGGETEQEQNTGEKTEQEPEQEKKYDFQLYKRYRYKTR